MDNQDLMTLAAVISAVVVVGGAVVRILTAIILAKLPSFKRAEQCVTDQAVACKMEHSALTTILKQQGETLKGMLAQNNKLLENIEKAQHLAELRHERVMNRIEKLENKINQ
jgi:hypothetical protein